MKTAVMLLSSATLLCAENVVFGQSEVDALRYSRNFLSGTARYTAMGGSFGALGADFSNLSVNPAGIALYRKSELTFTPSMFARNTTSTYNGSKLANSKYSFNISNAGFAVATYNDEKETGWVGSGFALGYNRLANFNNRIDIEGENNSSSFLDIFVNSINNGQGTAVSQFDPLGEKLLWETYLINPVDSVDTMHYRSALPAGTGLLQRKNIETSGSMGEFLFNFGGNYANRLLLGVSVGMPMVNYTETALFQEIPEADTSIDLSSYNFNQELSTTGIGYNFKLGFIYRVTDWMRFGGAVHTPTFFRLSDNYSNEVNSKFKDGQKYTSSGNGKFEYELSTPLTFTGSIAFVIGKTGIINADYEYLDYSEPRLRSSSYKFFDENKAIENKYTAASNIRVGTEWLVDVFSVRGGVGLYGNPYKNNVNDAAAIVYSGGFGIREHGYFLDFGYSFTAYKENYYLYEPSLANPTNLSTYFHNFLITLGYKF